MRYRWNRLRFLRHDKMNLAQHLHENPMTMNINMQNTVHLVVVMVWRSLDMTLVLLLDTMLVLLLLAHDDAD